MRYAGLLNYQDARSGLITYCYEILIGERLVRQMKKYKEAREERFVYSADSFVLSYLFTDGQTDCLNTENFTTRLVLAETFSVPNTHCLPTNSSPCSPSISGDISESSN